MANLFLFACDKVRVILPRMKIYIAHASSFPYEKELYEPLRSSPLAQEHDLVFPHEAGRDVNTKALIESCDIVVAEVSYSSIGLGIEPLTFST